MTTTKKRITITLTESNAKKFEQLSNELGFSKSGLITKWINETKK